MHTRASVKNINSSVIEENPSLSTRDDFNTRAKITWQSAETICRDIYKYIFV